MKASSALGFTGFSSVSLLTWGYKRGEKAKNNIKNAKTCFISNHNIVLSLFNNNLKS
jgi:hypothetical protein